MTLNREWIRRLDMGHLMHIGGQRHAATIHFGN